MDTAKEEAVLPCFATISHKPVRCPLPGCNMRFGVKEIFRHFVHDHQRHAPYRIYNISKQGVELQLALKLQTLNLGENTCLAFLAYANKQKNLLPAQRDLCLPNEQLLPAWQQHEYHLPILLLVCRKSFYTFNGDTQLEQKLQHTANSPESEVYFLWFAAPETTKPVYVNLLLYNAAHNLQRNTTMNLHNLADTQDPTEFLCTSPDFMLLNYNEVQNLSKNGNDFIYCVLTLNE